MFYRGTTVSILTYTSKINGAPLPILPEIYHQHYVPRASIIKDPHHHSHNLFSLLPSGRRYKSICAKSSRMLNNFHLQVVRTISAGHLLRDWQY